jgi:hypothetical protein
MDEKSILANKLDRKTWQYLSNVVAKFTRWANKNYSNSLQGIDDSFKFLKKATKKMGPFEVNLEFYDDSQGIRVYKLQYESFYLNVIFYPFDDIPAILPPGAPLV